jgi:MSHA biogenesis protein MshP
MSQMDDMLSCAPESASDALKRRVTPAFKARERGFSIVTAIFLLVVLSFLGVAMVTFSTTQHQSSAMDVMGSRAYQAARAGMEWAAYGVTNTASGVEWTGCTAATPATTIPAGTLPGTLSPFTVEVRCSRLAASEVGATPSDQIWLYDIAASAATGGTSADQGYVERVISVRMGN